MTSVNSPIINLYPDSFNLDLLLKISTGIIPILPDLEIDNVKKVSKIDKLDNSNYIKEVIIL